MKNITTKLALVAVLLANIASVGAMSRFAAIRQINKATKARTVLPLGGRVAVEKYHTEMIAKIKKGECLSEEEFAKLDSHSLYNEHGPLNLPDYEGSTILNYALIDIKNKLSDDSYRKMLHQLYARGAALNAYEKNNMKQEQEEALKMYLNTSHSKAATIVKIYKTLLTKNTADKIAQKISAKKMSESDADNRNLKVDITKNIFTDLENDLLKRTAQERTQLKRDARMPH